MIGSRRWRWFRFLGVFAIVVVAAVALAACGDDGDSTSAADTTGASTATAEGPFKVLVIWPLSGPLAVSGEEEKAGLDAAANVINGTGGILGAEVEITYRDDGGDGAKAVSIAQEELGADPEKYNLIVPGVAGFDAVPLAPQLASNPTLQITTAAEEDLNDPSKYPNLYTSLNGFQANAEGMMEKLEEEGISKVAFIGGENPSGEGNLEAMEEQADAHGIEITASVLVPEESADATAQMQKAVASNPEALISGAFTLTAPVITKARAKVAPELPWFADTFFDALNFGEFASDAELAGMQMQSFPFLVKGDPTQKEPWYQKFDREVSKLVKEPRIARISQVVAYNALILARAAAEKAGSIEGAAMAEVMEEISSATEVPDFVGTEDTEIYSPDDHIINVKGSNLSFYNAGPQEGGLLAPLR